MLIILLIAAATAWLFIKQWKSLSNYPLGPTPFPLIGNLPQIFYYSYKKGGIVPFFNELQKKYGNVFTLWMGPLPTVHITNHQIAQEVMTRNGHKYADRGLISFFEYTRKGKGVLVTNGANWNEQRRFALQVLRDMGMGKELMEHQILDELNYRCEEIDEKMDSNGVSVVEASDLFDIMVGSVINRLLIGHRLEKDSDYFWQVKRKLSKSGELVSFLDLVMPMWFMQTFFSKKFKQVTDNEREVVEFVSKDAVKRVEEVKSGKRHVDKDSAEDFVDFYIVKMLEQDKDMNDEFFNVDNLKMMLVDLWEAGQETTATTITSGFNQLLNHPEVVAKLRKELLQVTDNHSRDLSLKDKAKTPYLNAVLNEIQRHASILNINFFRVNHEPTTINGQPCDAGAWVTAQLSALHTNDEVFKESARFYPERFIEDEKLGAQVIPFGIGKRSCLGEGLARAELYLLFGNLLLRYDIKPHGKMPCTKDRVPMSMAKKPERAKIEFIKLKH